MKQNFEYSPLNVYFLINFKTFQYTHVHSLQETQICYHCSVLFFISDRLVINIQVLSVDFY